MKRSTSALLLAALAVWGCHTSRGGRASAAGILVTHAVIPASPTPQEASAFLVIENLGDGPVTFTGAQTPDADSVLLHQLVGGLMQPSTPLTIPVRGHINFEPGGYHLMLEGLKRPLAVGDTVTLRLRFGVSAEVAVQVPVLNYTDAVSELPSGR